MYFGVKKGIVERKISQNNWSHVMAVNEHQSGMYSLIHLWGSFIDFNGI